MKYDARPGESADDSFNQLDMDRLVEGVYRAVLDRAPNVEERASGSARLMAGGLVQDLVSDLLRSPECQAEFFRNVSFRELVAPPPLPADTPRLYLWHIPKTGGSSLRVMLSPHFAPHESCGPLTLSELYRLSPSRLRSYRFISGHLGPALPRLLGDVPLVTVTVLRDPVATVLSTYGQLQRGGPFGHPPSDLARELPFDEWCRHEEARLYWSNPQARFLAVERTPPAWPVSHEPAEGDPTPLPDGELGKRALSQLRAIDVVGTTDNILALYLEALRRLGIAPGLSNALRLNIGEGANEISPATMDWLYARNAVDVALFEEAKRRGRALARWRLTKLRVRRWAGKVGRAGR
jgi:hypothetical protein